MSKVLVGFGRKNINPPMKMGLGGYFNTRIWENVLDDLEVRVAAFQENKKFAFVIQYDLITCTAEMFTLLKEKLNQIELGDATLLTTATHAHTAPEIRIGRGGYCQDYVKFAVEKTVEALKSAISDMEEATISMGTAMENSCSFNRRFWMKDGSVASNPGKLNPNIVRPEGEIDPEIPMTCFTSATGKKLLLCSICNHADTTGGNDVSADWPGWARRLVEGKLGKGSMMMPLIGCSGDINHFDVSYASEQTSPQEAERIGRSYATAIIGKLDQLREESLSLKFSSIPFDLPGREIFPEEMEDAKNIMQKYQHIKFDSNSAENLTAEDFAQKSPKVLKYFAQSLLNVAENPKTFRFEISYINFGKSAIVGLPAEPFTATGLIIRKNYLFGKTALISVLNNGSGTGYIPNSWNYGRGGYETTVRSNQFSIHAFENILKITKSLIQQVDVQEN